MWLTMAEFESVVRALPVSFTLLLYMELMSVARVSAPVTIARQKN